MKKLFRVMMILLIIFMQLSSPIQIFADVIDEEVKDNETLNNNNLEEVNIDNDNILDSTESDINKDEVNDNNLDNNNNNNEDIIDNKDNDNLDDEIDNTENNKEDSLKEQDDTTNIDNNTNEDISNNLEDVNYQFDIDGSVNNNKVLVNVDSRQEGKFISVVKLTFSHILNGDIKDTKEEEKLFIIDNNAIEFNDIGANLNGEYNIDVNVYKLDDTIENNEELLREYISDKEAIYNYSKMIHENNISVEFSIFSEGNDEVVCSNKECNLANNASNKIVNVSYSVSEGDIDISNSYVKYSINNKIELNNINLNFDELIYGSYKIKGILYDSNDTKIAEDVITINYDEFNNNNLADYFTDSNILDTNKDISMSLLNDNDKKELLKEVINKAFEDKLECGIDIDSDSNYLLVKDCYGKVSEDDILPSVSDIINVLNNLNMNATILDKNNEVAILEDDITTRMVLNVNFYDIEESYTIIVKGDLNSGLVDDTDISMIIDNLFGDSEFDDIDKYTSDVNNDGNIDILDISMYAGAICDKFWYKAYNQSDNLIANFERVNNNAIRVGDTFKINLVVSGFENDYMNAIYGLLNYDKSVFELVNISGVDKLLEFSKLDDDKFIYAGSYMYEDATVLVLTFKAISASNSTISLSDLIGGMDGVKLNITNNASIDINVEDKSNDTAIVVDFSEKDYEEATDSVNTSESSVVSKTDVIVDIPTILENKIYYNNYLAKLEIKDYEIDFNKEILEYSITVDNDVDSLDIVAIAEDSRSNVTIYGNSNFKEGENIVKIEVKSPDGSSRTYIIKVNKKKADVTKKIDSVDQDSGNNTEKTIIIILIILVALGLLYLIFSKDNEEEKK